ncbi:MAG: DUF4236 domain-containing protein [Synechococcus sp. SB0666_bin_14]|nr:DUF4236 domain-containing protein [Synechococcus sp. SB0666_bin_14]MYA90751.1 DUF4236 domain-containing protein [Synechococcus sp. SB0663_bin_10]MYG47145.1 DUF4236 domain-containing protein [Synechococcus sp. SB0675_bin_6]MYJ59056.1 DUF4236 domain-containing protein [Synechococcus sp. SB0672_bin_6]MYK91654.1 DUF4236 domain-containing protein [Synechococcus sp. SB0669_bin_8]
MAWAFRRRIKVIPGVTINLSKSGISTSVGVRGASLTFKSDGVYRNLGLPGTGIYSREKVGAYGRQGAGKATAAPTLEPAQASPDYSFRSADPVQVTSESLLGLQLAVIDARQQRQELVKDAASIQQSLASLNWVALLCKICLIYFLVALIRKRFQSGIKARGEALQEVEQAIENSSVSLAIAMDDDCRAAFRAVQSTFDRLSNCQFIWDLTSASNVDQVRSRSATSISFDRSLTKCQRKALSGITSPELPLVFLNRNGADIYIYPGFFVMDDSLARLGILDMKELEVDYTPNRFIEKEAIPQDSKRVGQVWEKSNKDGSRDRRYSENRQWLVMEYGEVTFRSGSGIHEKYLFSDAEAAESFVDLLVKFKNLI